MARKVVITLSGPQEAALMDRYGRKCNLEGLVLRAVKEVVAMQAEDVGVFKTRAEFEVGEIARMQAAAKEFFTKRSRVPLDVRMRLSEYGVGVPLFDKDGRQVSALVITSDEEMIDQGHWLVAQFDGDNSEWFPVTPGELSVDKPSEAEQERAFREAVGFVKPATAPSAEQIVQRFLAGEKFVDSQGRRIIEMTEYAIGPASIDGLEDDEDLAIRVEGEPEGGVTPVSHREIRTVAD